MAYTALEQRLYDLAQPIAQSLGLRLVQVQIGGTTGAQLVQIFALNPERDNLSLGECTALSQGLSAVLDVADPLSGAYRLEVSSPGIDRPLLSPADYARFLGLEIRVELTMPLPCGQKKFRGVLQACEEETFTLNCEGAPPVTLSYGAVRKARPVMNDELIKATSKHKKEDESDGIDTSC